ncbi:hypothetical protein SAMN05444858_103227 [Micromonospora avicenniae]|uniref:Uncharacterized protein n=1 Tax=Micromonospora avicenniae TaxID=1198245 RepID=A0A1N6U5C1_9ACTN|nr:hypothetical protein SAMN05444858_103227 [Micromonospora avicenniae]
MVLRAGDGMLTETVACLPGRPPELPATVLDEAVPPTLALPTDAPRLHFLSSATPAAAATFPADRGRIVVPASTLLQPRVLEYARTEWRGY